MIKHAIMIMIFTGAILSVFLGGIVGGAVGMSGAAMVIHWVMDGVDGDNFRNK